MNGRIYDPELGRMLSPDPIVQVPEFSQNHNRYSYVLNNPLNMTDPTGFSWLSKAFHKVGHWLHENWRTVVTIVVGAILMFTPGGQAFLGSIVSGIYTGITGAATVAGMSGSLYFAGMGAVSGSIMGGLNAALNGGDLGDVLRGAVIGGVSGALTGGMGNGVGSSFSAGDYGLCAAYIAGHGVVGGAVNEVMGGKFQDGFLSAAAGAASQIIPFANGGTAGLIKAGFVGGTASSLGGGKFANGASMAAFQYLVASGANSLGKGSQTSRFSELNKSLDAVGKIWNLPNTAIGLMFGFTGYAWDVLSGRNQAFITMQHNAIEFHNNPFVSSAITIGNTINYGSSTEGNISGAYDYAGGPHQDGWGKPQNWIWNARHVFQHEMPHTYQGQLLGPFYLLSNISGMALALAINGNTHGPLNWNERGPQSLPPSTWNFSPKYP